MSRATLILANESVRSRAMGWVKSAPVGTRLEFREPKRTLPQNDRFWATMTDIARQRPTHNGVKMNAELWRSVFMQAFGVETIFVPTLDGDGMFPLGHRSSELSVGEMSALLDFVYAWAAREGLELSDQRAMGRVAA